MTINQKTTVSLGIVVLVAISIVSIIPQCLPLFGNIVTKDWLEVNNEKMDDRFQSLEARISRLETLLEKRFDKLETKIDNL